MSTVNEKLLQLQEKNRHVLMGGVKERMEAPHAAALKAAHERLHLLIAVASPGIIV